MAVQLVVLTPVAVEAVLVLVVVAVDILVVDNTVDHMFPLFEHIAKPVFRKFIKKL